MNDIPHELILPGVAGDLTQFDPKQTQHNVRRLDAVIKEAAALRDWELLQQAAEFQVAEQVKFVQWWTETVGVRESLNRFTIANPDPGSLSVEQTQKDTGIRQQRVSRWRKALAKQDEYLAKIIAAARKEAGWFDEHLAFDEGNDEWCTPPEYIKLARTVMGDIDLDPASNEGGQRNVQATLHYTAEDDGLTKPWDGRVWLNPPYSKGTIDLFVQKLLDELACGHTKQAVVLVNAATSSEWFHRLGKHADAVCFARERIKFLKRDGSPAEGSPPIGQTFFYCGPDGERFAETFHETGWVVGNYFTHD